MRKYHFFFYVYFTLSDYVLGCFNHLDTILPSEDFKFEPTSYKNINDTKIKRLQIHLLIAKMTYWVVCVTKYRMKLKKHENVRWYEILRIVRTQLVGTIKVESVDRQVSSIRHSKEQRVNSPSYLIGFALHTSPNHLGKEKHATSKSDFKKPNSGDQELT